MQYRAEVSTARRRGVSRLAIMQALGPTIVTAAIGGFAWYIAWQQWRTAEKKQTQDLFEKRFRVFEATRHFLGEIELHGKPSKDALRLYAIASPVRCSYLTMVSANT